MSVSSSTIERLLNQLSECKQSVLLGTALMESSSLGSLLKEPYGKYKFSRLNTQIILNWGSINVRFVVRNSERQAMTNPGHFLCILSLIVATLLSVIY